MRHLAATFVVLAGCAAALPDVTLDSTVPSPMVPPEGQALLVFYRPRDTQLRAGVIDTDGRFITTVDRGNFVPIAMPEGQHDFVVLIGPVNAALLRTHLTAGRTYFVSIGITVGLWKPRLRVEVGKSASDITGLRATIPVNVQEAQNVLHDTWDVPTVIERAVRQYDALSADERRASTLSD